ncbi:MAG: FAD-dependent oxidoreductase [Verrucomicrobiae bacterium]|nr:FAD-dependent oxidoreductase [Verrucomicrobiae bacterium]
MLHRLRFSLLLALGFASLPCRAADISLRAGEMRQVDVCVYTATPSGILAALAVKRAGKSVLIVEPSRWVGGILGAGIKPLQDCPNPAATGGLTHELLFSLGNSPEIIRANFAKLLEEHGIEVIFDHRVATVEKDDTLLRTATFDRAPFDSLGCPPPASEESMSLRVAARVFIDASYEGELMARSGVSSRIDRESVDTFDEEVAGIREPVELTPIDPFVTPGDPTSGLLPWITAQHDEPLGSASPRIQAYNYRFYLTNDPEKLAPLTPPDNYDPAEFELVGRYVDYLKSAFPDAAELHQRLARIFPGWMNSGEYNYHRNSLVTNAPVGISHRYAGGDYAEKARVWKAHQDYLRGLHHFMSTDPRVPASFREETAALGLDLSRHPETEGWPHQLYIRLTRRLEGRYTLTAHDVYNRTSVDDPVALAQYGIDTYPSRRVWLERDGETFVGLEGWMFVGGSKGPTKVPYPIPYRSLTPREDEASNLLVSVCFSASFLGYASARMEPTFMMCGEASGVAACQALEEGTSVQAIDPGRFRNSLEEAGAVLEWDETRKAKAADAERKSWVVDFFTRADLDRDGRVSQKEWDARKQGWEWLFPKIDGNRDGLLDEAEYAAFQELKEKDPEWRRKLGE